jgi:hypothetical protein
VATELGIFSTVFPGNEAGPFLVGDKSLRGEVSQNCFTALQGTSRLSARRERATRQLTPAPACFLRLEPPLVPAEQTGWGKTLPRRQSRFFVRALPNSVAASCSIARSLLSRTVVFAIPRETRSCSALAVRLFQGSPVEEYRRTWDQLQEACPEWPGFRRPCYIVENGKPITEVFASPAPRSWNYAEQAAPLRAPLSGLCADRYVSSRA